MLRIFEHEASYHSTITFQLGKDHSKLAELVKVNNLKLNISSGLNYILQLICILSSPLNYQQK